MRDAYYVTFPRTGLLTLLQRMKEAPDDNATEAAYAGLLAKTAQFLQTERPDDQLISGDLLDEVVAAAVAYIAFPAAAEAPEVCQVKQKQILADASTLLQRVATCAKRAAGACKDYLGAVGNGGKLAAVPESRVVLECYSKLLRLQRGSSAEATKELCRDLPDTRSMEVTSNVLAVLEACSVASEDLASLNFEGLAKVASSIKSLQGMEEVTGQEDELAQSAWAAKTALEKTVVEVLHEKAARVIRAPGNPSKKLEDIKGIVATAAVDLPAALVDKFGFKYWEMLVAWDCQSEALPMELAGQHAAEFAEQYVARVRESFSMACKLSGMGIFLVGAGLQKEVPLCTCKWVALRAGCNSNEWLATSIGIGVAAPQQPPNRLTRRCARALGSWTPA